MVKSITRIPRVALSSQVSAADLAIIILFALGGLAGFPGFAKYSDIKSQIANLDYKLIWACLLFIFTYLLIYRKIRRCYFDWWLARFHAFLINAVIATGCVVLAKLFLLSSMSSLDAIIAVLSGLAAVYLIVQGWMDFKPDVASLAKLSSEIDVRVRVVESLNGGTLENTELKRISDLCGKFARDTDAAIFELSRDASGQSKLSAEKNRVDKIFQAIKAPLSEVPEALRRAREAH